VDTIFARGVLLRRIREEDLPLVAAWSCSPEAHGEFLSVEGLSLSGCRARFANNGFWSAASGTYLIELRKGGAIGTIHYWRRSDKPDTAVVSVKIAIPAFRGLGYGFAAQKGLINHLFKVRKMAKVEMYTDMDNLAQQKCLAKLGFSVVESLHYQDMDQRRNGRFCRLTRQQFQTLLVYTLPI